MNGTFSLGSCNTWYQRSAKYGVAIMSFSKKSTAVAIASALTLTGLGTTTTAHAHDAGWSHTHRNHQMKRQLNRHLHRNIIVEQHTHHHHSTDAQKVGGVLLGILGTAIVVDALTKANNAPQPAYPTQVYKSHPTPYPPAPSEPYVVYHTQCLEPWRDGWRAWCHENYKTFNEHTGTYRGYDGLDHFCVPK